jgi:hypothetical protein
MATFGCWLLRELGASPVRNSAEKGGRIEFARRLCSAERSLVFFNFRTAPDFSQVGEKVGLRHFINVPPECLSPPYTVAWSFSFSAFWLKSLGKSAAAAVAVESSDIIERRQKTNTGFHSRSPRAAESDRSYIDDKSRTLDGEHHLSLMRAR